MPLPAGSRIGSYEVVAKLGEGGMGEVYRARDPRLQRDVALKVLPDVAAADPDRRERFRREALAVAALNHPHIVTIHSVEEADGIAFLTMELVEGRSLADVVPPAGLPLERVLTIGIAVADAVAAAHQKSITHRDLKPGNIMLGEGEQAGRIKVLDFGLAKVVESQRGAAGASGLPTVAPTHSGQITAEGRILGTVAYMSPEQAEGKAVDGRSDLFSLGVVLYEMATGQRPFSGDSSLSILSSILRDAPRPVTDINPALPRDLGRIIRRALAKDADRRYQTAKDLRNDLEDLKSSLDSGELAAEPAAARLASASTSASSATPAVPAPSSDAQVAVALVRRHAGGLAAGLVLLVAGILTTLYVLRQPGQETASTGPTASPALADLQVAQLTTSGSAERAAISPDGRYVAYVQHDGAGDSLWIRQTATTSNVRIVAPEKDVTLLGATFAPDGTSIDFVREPMGRPADIWRVPFLGGTPRLLIADTASSLAWAPDGRRVAFLRSQVTPLRTQLMLANADGTQERALLSPEPPTLIVSLMAPWRPNIPPAWSPDGRLIAVLAVEVGQPGPAGRVLVVDSGTGSSQGVALAAVGTEGLGWLDAQSLVLNLLVQIGAPTQLFHLAYPSGTLSRLTNDLNDYRGVSLTGDSTGLVTSRRDSRMDVWLGDGAGTTGADVAGRVTPGVARIAWAGDQLLYGAFVAGKPAVLRLTPGGSAPEVVLSDAASPAATADGRTIAFVSASLDDQLTLWTATASGRRIVRLAPQAPFEQVVVTPDDQFVLFSSLTGGTVAIWMVPIAGGSPTKLANGTTVDVSPDGRSIVFIAPEPENRASLVVCGFPGCTSPRKVGSVDYRTTVRWLPAGDGIAYASQGNLWVQPLDGGAPRQLTRFTDGRAIGSFAWSRDGKRLAIARLTVTDDIVLFTGLK